MCSRSPAFRLASPSGSLDPAPSIEIPVTMVKGDPTRLEVSTLLSIIDTDRPEARREARSARLDALKAWKEALLRRDEAARGLRAATGEASQGPPESTLPAAPQEPPIEPLDPAAQARARSVAAIGSTVPDFPYYGRLRRFFARITARGVLYLAGIVTSHQRIVNSALLDHARESTDRINRLVAAAADSLRRDSALQQTMDGIRSEHAERLHEHTVRLLEKEQALTTVQCEQAWLRLAEIEHREELDDIARRLERAERLCSTLDGPRGDGRIAHRAVERDVPGTKPVGHVKSELDQLYLSLEEEFRGPRDLIKKRFETYLPLLRDRRLDHPTTRILDLGSGRGEWLELLSEHGYVARGVEVNRLMVSQCRDLGLDVVADDALDYLRRSPDESLDVVTGFHLLEHLPFDDIVTLLDMALRKLRPGGITIFETPNPENLTVTANLFHCDPTHRHPLHPELLRFLMRQRGYVELEIRHLHELRRNKRFKTLEERHPEAKIINPIVDFLNLHFAAATDFAAIGSRP